MSRARRSGQGLVEYSLIILLIALAALGGLTVFGASVSSFLASVTI
jgi:Flp pilus assembly pilin Flp